MLNVFSEVNRLKKVMLHRPGEELHTLNEDNLQNKLFDELPDLSLAVKEHDLFADLLKKEGVEIVYLEDLMAQVLNDEMIKDSFIRQYLKEAHKEEEALYQELSSIKDAKELVLKTMSGLNGKIEPLPNLYFTRDSFTIIGKGIALYNMHTEIRDREVIYGEYINKYHPDFMARKYYERSYDTQIEGGDVQILSDEVVAIGVSERTAFASAQRLANALIGDGSFLKALIMTIPSKRSCMHLDTVFTMLDVNRFAIYEETYKVMKMKIIDKDGVKDVDEDLKCVLARLLHVEDIRFIICDDEDEQWNDACNALCVAPNRFIVYDVNRKMNEAYRQMGAQVITLPSKELLKGRGGPHCMSMPLIRE